MSERHPKGLGSSLYIEAILCYYENEPPPDVMNVEINLYPNPASSLLVCSVVCDGENEFQTVIYDTQGHQQHVNVTYYNNDFMIDVSSLGSGVYIFCLHSPVRKYYRKFVKI
jgi:hypothetical protein